MKISGIYQIQSKIKPERIYIGSAININNRWIRHRIDLKANIHGNIKLQRHYNKYGKEDLIFSLIVGCSKENLIAYEQFYIDSLNPWFNILPKAGSLLGFKKSKESKKKQSETRKRKFKSGELVMAISQERRNKTRATLMGHPVSDKSKEKNRQKHLGNKNRLGRLHTEESKEKNRQSHLGKKHSEETKQKMRLSSPRKQAGSGRLGIGREVINVSTGEIFNTIRLASKSINIKYRTLHAQLLEQNPNKTDYKLLNKSIS